MKGFVCPISQLSNNFMMFLFIARTGKSQEMMMVLKSCARKKQTLISTMLIDNN